MTEIKQNGLVILEKDLPENDKLLVILTERYGKLPVIAKGVKSVKNRHIASCQLFSYASFGLRKRGNYYYITDSDLIENYYNIRNDIVRLALASYICDVVNDVTQEGNNDDEILRLSLNILYAIANEIKPLNYLKAIFETRLACELGFTPDVSSCSRCGEESSKYLFDIIDGNLLCEKCKNSIIVDTNDIFMERGLNKPVYIVSSSVVKAIEYVCTAKQERILSFIIDELDWLDFCSIAEKFLLNHLERGFYSLDFYKTLIS